METNNSQKTTFWHFLEHHTVEIPIIQRDYAQGRSGKEYLRKGFLSSLKEALDDSQDKQLKLDFVYGTNENGKLYPLDGQQRLTTLWLLHWYIALMSGNLKEENCKVLANFTYQTRVSSRNFCEELCNCKEVRFNTYDPITSIKAQVAKLWLDKHPQKSEQTQAVVNAASQTIADYITNQTWFSSAWKQDPTIKSMLIMLAGTKNKDKEGVDIIDGIEEVFCRGIAEWIYEMNKDKRWEDIEQIIDTNTEIEERIDTLLNNFKAYCELLQGENCPIIFYYLPISTMGLSDDLYIKMNARGKQLSSFENFKADLIGYIEQKANANNLEAEQWSELSKSFPNLLDTTWTDIFWNNRSEEQKDSNDRIIEHSRIDEIYFAFINRFFSSEAFIEKFENKEPNSADGTFQSLYNGSDDSTIAFLGFNTYLYKNGEIPIEFFHKLMRVLNNYKKYLKESKSTPDAFDNEKLCRFYEKDFRFIPKYFVKEENGEKKGVKIIDIAGNEILEVAKLGQIPRIIFFAVCKFFAEESEADKADIAALDRWMRVVWNLVSGRDADGNAQIRTIDAMGGAIKFISKLNSHYIYASLLPIQVTGNSDFDKRCIEESDKAMQITLNRRFVRLDGKSWEQTIAEAENALFFRGSIRFLFHDESGKVDWSDFDTKYQNAQFYFDKNGIKSNYVVALTKALVVQYEWSDLRDRQIFNPNANTWRWILCTASPKKIHNILKCNYIQPIRHHNDPAADKYIRPILDKLPFETMIRNEPTGRFRWNVRLGYYRPYGQTAFTIDWNDFHRNAYLNVLLDCQLITLNSHCIVNPKDNLKFFWGWDVVFKCSGRKFLWKSDNKIYYENVNGKKKVVPFDLSFEPDSDEKKQIRILSLAIILRSLP